MKKIYFENLDALRFFAFFAVFGLHSKLRATLLLLSDNNLYKQFIIMITGGGIGVSFFFVLSGFLITYLLLIEKEKNGTIQLIKFYIRRFLRIWPLYFFLVAFSFFIMPTLFKLLGGYALRLPYNLAYYATFLSNFGVIEYLNTKANGSLALIFNITWSVSVEEQFYLFWPLLFILFKKKYYIFIFFIVIFFSFAFNIYYYNKPALSYYHTFAVMSDLAIGGLGAYCVLNYKQFYNSLLGLNPYIIFAIYICGFTALMYASNWIPFVYLAATTRIIYSVFFIFIILEQCFTTRSVIKLGRFKFLSYWGKLTFGLYMLHPIAIVFTEILFKKIKFSDSTFGGGILATGISFILACLMSFCSYNLMEQPFLKFKENFNSKH